MTMLGGRGTDQSGGESQQPPAQQSSDQPAPSSTAQAPQVDEEVDDLPF